MTGPDDPNGGEAPAPDALLAVDAEALLRALPSMPDEWNAVLRLVDGRRTVAEIAAVSGSGPDAARESLRRLLATGALRIVEPPGPAAAPPPVGPAPVAPTPAPEGAAWFADPAGPDRDDPADDAAVPVGLLAEPEPAPVPAPAAVRTPAAPEEPPAAAEPRSMRAWMAVAALLVAAAVVAGVVARSGVRAGTPRAPVAPGPAVAPVPPAPAATVPEAIATARALLAAGDAGAAAIASRRAIELDPSSGPAWTLLGEAHLAAGDPARARAAFERSLAVDPDGPGAAAARDGLGRLRP